MASLAGNHQDVTCEVCGSNGGLCFEVRLGGDSHVFDSFDCALIALSTVCGYCGCRILGHTIVFGNTIYCSYECANDDSARQYEAQLKLKEQLHL